MATIESYATSAGKRYRVRYRTPDRKQTDKRGFRTKRDAEAFAATVEVEKLTGSYVAPSLGRITVAELAIGWLERKKVEVAPSNYRTLESAWRIHVKPRWGATQIVHIGVDGVEKWITDMGAAGSGATTVIRAHGVLAGILDAAVRAKPPRLAKNEARLVDNLPEKTSKRHVYLSHADVGRLADESGQHRVLVLTLAYCGIRWGEAVALRVRDIEFLRKGGPRITVADNAVQLGVDHAVGLPKSKKVRPVPVPKFVLDELSIQCQGRDLGDLVFGDGVSYLPRSKSDGGWFVGAVKRSKVQAITPHDLRHTCASLAISAGVNVLTLARMLGHDDPAVTLRVYADLFDTDLDRAGITLDDAYSPASVGERWAGGPPAADLPAQKSSPPA